jgi:dipeptidase D
MLQGHLDMVCEKTADKTIDFLNDPLTLVLDGDELHADRTTLGGDDGIAVAMILAIIADKSLAHPPLEAVFTTDEETGMCGAAALDCSVLKSRVLINLDSEEESTVWVACAGGMRADVTLPIAFENDACPACRVTLGGLAGGHSGAEIDKGRINATRLLAKAIQDLPVRLCSLEGGLADNAIPREATAVVCGEAEALNAALAALAEDVRAGACNEDKALGFTVEAAAPTRPMTAEAAARVLGFVTEAPNGVQAMSRDIEGLVQTSLNLGITRTGESAQSVTFSLRSSVGDEKEALYRELCACAETFGGTVSRHGDYPAWEYSENSPLRDLYARTYERVTGRPCAVKAIHAGLECGIFYEKMNAPDCISVGPDMRDIHTPQETLFLPSVRRVYAVVKEVLCAL